MKRIATFVVLTILLMTFVMATPDITSDLQAHYKLDVDESPQTDTTGNWGNAVVGGSPVFVADGMNGGALDFESTDPDTLDCGSQFPGSDTDFTVSAWFRAESWSATAHIFESGITNGAFKGWSMHSPGSKQLRFRVRGSGSDGTVTVSNLDTAEWYLGTGTYDATSDLLSFYIDGTLIGTDTNAFDVSGNDECRIGTENANTGREWDGYLDDIRFYDRELTHEEVIEIYRTTWDKYQDAKIHWSFDSDLTDLAGSSDLTNSSLGLVTGGVNGTYQVDIEQDSTAYGSRADDGANSDLDMTNTDACWVWYSAIETAQVHDRIFRKSGGSNGWSIQIKDNSVGECDEEWCLCWVVEGEERECQGDGYLGDAHTYPVQYAISYDYDGKTAVFYKNGVPIVTETYATADGIDEETTTFYMGQSGAGEYYDGQIDEVFVYHQTCGEAQVSSLFTQYSPDFQRGMVNWWNFTGGNAEDVLGSHDVDDWDAGSGVTFTDGAVFDGTDDGLEDIGAEVNPLITTQDWSICMDFNLTETTTDQSYLIYDQHTSGNGGWAIRYRNAFQIWYKYPASETAVDITNVTVTAGVRTKVCVAYDYETYTLKSWQDGSHAGTQTLVDQISENTGANEFRIGIWNHADSGWFKGNIYEICTFQTHLYDDDGIDYGTYGCAGNTAEDVSSPPTSPPTLALTTSLTNNIDSILNPYYFNITSASMVNITTDAWNCSMYMNSSLNTTLLDVPLNNTYQTFNLTYGDEQVGYDINVTCSRWDQGEFAVDSFLKTNVFLDSVPPEINISANVINNTEYWYHINTLSHWFEAIDNNLFAVNVTYFRLNGDGSYNQTMNNTFVDNINTTSYIVNYTGNNSLNLVDNGYTNGSYKIEVWAWDSHTNNKVKPLYWNLSEPDKIIMEDIVLEGAIKEEQTEFLLSGDRYKFKITWDVDSLNHELIISATGDLTFIPGSDWRGHFVHFDSRRWIDFESPNIKDVVVTDLGNNRYRLNIELYTMSDEVEFESIGSLNEEKQFYYFTVTNPFSFYARDVFTNATINNFTIDVINTTDWSIVQSKNTTSGVVRFNITNSQNYWTNFSSPSHAKNNTNNISFVPNGNFTYSVFASNSLYLFVYDEVNDTLITNPNVTIRIINYDNQSVEQVTAGGSLFYSGLSTGDYEIRYSANGYNTRSYYTTITDSSTQQIELFLLTTAQADYTSFIIEDETGNTIEGTTLQGYRHFIDCNCFKVVEMDKSTFSGIATLSLQQQEARYRFIVLGTDGTTIYSSTSQEGYKITETSYTLTATLLGDTTESFFGTTTLYHNLSYSNATKQFYFTVNDPTALVDQFCVYVDQYTLTSQTGKETICSNCVNASTGTAICNVSSYIADGKEMVARGWIHTNTEFSEYWVDVISVFNDLEAVSTMGTFGVFLGFIVILTMFFAGLVLAGFGGAIIMFDIGLIMVSILQLVKISFPILLGVISVSFLVMLLLGDR